MAGDIEETCPIPWDQPGADPPGDLARAAAQAMRATSISVAKFCEAMRAWQPLIAEAYIEGQFRALEACGGRRPLVGKDRAEHWRRVLTP